MKITDLSVTMFNWKSAAWRTGSGSFGGNRLLGVVTLQTDAGSRAMPFSVPQGRGLRRTPAAPRICQTSYHGHKSPEYRGPLAPAMENESVGLDQRNRRRGRGLMGI